MTNRSTYPTTLDSFIEKHEILASDIPNIQRYQTLLLKSPRTSAEEDEFSNLKITLNDKLVSSEDWNKLQDAITNMESYLTSSIDTHMTTTIANADADIDAKVQSVKDYLDTTSAGSVRNDLGILTDLTTTDTSNVIHAVNEVKSEANTNKTNIGDLTTLTSTDKSTVVKALNEHVAKTNNPHGTTASQVGAYTTSQVDTKITALDANPYFRLVWTTGVNYNTINADLQIPFTSSNVNNSSGVTVGTNQITINTDGIYYLYADLQLSGLNSNIIGTVKIRMNVGGTTSDLFRSYRGATGWDGANGGGVWLRVGEVYPLTAGTILTFLGSIGESPRTITQLNAGAYKISKNTVGV